MIWHENLYIGDSIPRKDVKLKHLKWKINHNAFLPNIFIIVLCRYGTNLLEIIPVRELKQKHYPKQNLYVVGLAGGYDEALETAAEIICDVYKKTGGFEVKRCLLRPRKAGDSI